MSRLHVPGGDRATALLSAARRLRPTSRASLAKRMVAALDPSYLLRVLKNAQF